MPWAPGSLWPPGLAQRWGGGVSSGEWGACEEGVGFGRSAVGSAEASGEGRENTQQQRRAINDPPCFGRT